MWLEKFNEMRKNSGMSLDEISAKSGIPKGTLSKITAGITKAPPLETMRKLVYSMGYTLDDLDDNPPKREKSPSTAEAVPGEEQLISLYRDLNDEGREKLVDYADDLVSSGKYIKTSANQVGGEKLA